MRWSEKFTSILELAEACDVPVRWSCRTGVCHTCETGLLDGHVEYSPDPLEAPADGNVLVCCSRPGTDLVIDARPTHAVVARPTPPLSRAPSTSAGRR